MFQIPRAVKINAVRLFVERSYTIIVLRHDFQINLDYQNKSCCHNLRILRTALVHRHAIRKQARETETDDYTDLLIRVRYAIPT